MIGHVVKRAALVIGVILLPVGIFFALHNTIAKSDPALVSVCNSSASICIQITEADGPTYKLNDFRFYNGSCIKFISLPDGAMRSTCGKYTLKWIGPSGARRSV